ncbi:uncharacterized protein LOC142231357 [Haematobia irritans]|uniref:uncharacterized protein LOC142231357 n=1 Tax=Haematobia irritans TaxID=7368 RepID=UPI003F4FA485
MDTILKEIDMERSITTLLILDQNETQSLRLKEVFYGSSWPKVIVKNKNYSFVFKENFNMEILTLIIMEKNMDIEAIETCSEILHMRRQSRIWTIAVNINDTEKFKEDLKPHVQHYKTTNMILSFFYDYIENNITYYSLKPYPQYHWILKNHKLNGNIYYPQYWRNMLGAPLFSFTGQDPPGALVFMDEDGKLKFNGYVARMVLLFAEIFNATLQMYRPLKLGELLSYDDINILVNEELLDIPMALSVELTYKDVEKNSVYFDVIRPSIALPCPLRLTIREVFGLLLNRDFFGCVLVCALTLSILHSLIDYYFDDIFDPVKFFINDHTLPGILGQSFTTRNSPWRGLKIVYLLVSFAGLNIGTQFAANVSTLFSEQPYHKDIKTLKDFGKSSHNLLILEAHAKETRSNHPHMVNSITATLNGTDIINHIRVFNTSYGYAVTPPTWILFSGRQQFYSHKIFCQLNDPTFGRLLFHSVALYPQSPYREALNYLILRIHELGLIQAWHSSTFQDMVKLKLISLRDGNPMLDRRILAAEDFFWIWMVIIIGLSLAMIVFVIEHFSGVRCRKYCVKSKELNTFEI